MQLIRPIKTRFPFGSGAERLNLAAHHNSLARSTKSTWSLALPLLVSIRFQILFHSPPGVLFTFPSRYFSSIGHQVVFRLGGWSPPTSHRVPRVLRYSGSRLSVFSFDYVALTLSRRPSHAVRLDTSDHDVCP